MDHKILIITNEFQSSEYLLHELREKNLEFFLLETNSIKKIYECLVKQHFYAIIVFNPHIYKHIEEVISIFHNHRCNIDLTWIGITNGQGSLEILFNQGFDYIFEKTEPSSKIISCIQLVQKKHNIKENNKKKNLLNHNALYHEISNIQSIINMNIFLINKGEFHESMEKYIKKLQNNSDKMIEILKTLSEMNKIYNKNLLNIKTLKLEFIETLLEPMSNGTKNILIKTQNYENHDTKKYIETDVNIFRKYLLRFLNNFSEQNKLVEVFLEEKSTVIRDSLQLDIIIHNLTLTEEELNLIEIPFSKKEIFNVNCYGLEVFALSAIIHSIYGKIQITSQDNFTKLIMEIPLLSLEEI